MYSLIKGASKTVTRFVGRLFLAMIRLYQLSISPWLGPNCRFRPTCSAYAAEAVTKYGPAKGGWLAFKRILRCHPGFPGGYDPVP